MSWIRNTPCIAPFVQVEGVRSVHDLHLWSLTADLPAASVHLAVNPETDKEQVVTTFILALFVTNLICFAF
jgi:Co/Zn/Cd efflux system component